MSMRPTDLIRRHLRSVPARTAAALAAAALAVVVFVEVAENGVQDQAAGFDHAVTRMVRGLDSPAADVVMRAGRPSTVLGSGPVVVAVVALVVAWALRAGAFAPASLLIAVVSVAEGLNLLLKSAFHRARPDLPAEVALPSSYSFPSGHAMAAAATYGMAAIVIARLRPTLRGPAYVVTTCARPCGVRRTS